MPAPGTAIPAPPPLPARAAAGPAAPAAAAPDDNGDTVLIDRLCAEKLRHNEEDRLYGLISLTIRTSLSYEQAKLTAEQIDDDVQDALDALMKDCPRIVAADRPIGSASSSKTSATWPFSGWKSASARCGKRRCRGTRTRSRSESCCAARDAGSARRPPPICRRN